MGLLLGSAGAHTYLKSGQVAPPPEQNVCWCFLVLKLLCPNKIIINGLNLQTVLFIDLITLQNQVLQAGETLLYDCEHAYS